MVCDERTLWIGCGPDQSASQMGRQPYKDAPRSARTSDRMRLFQDAPQIGQQLCQTGNRKKCYVSSGESKVRRNSPSSAAGHAGSVDRDADRAGAVRDGQGGGLSDGVGVGAIGELGGLGAVGGVGGDDLGGVGHIFMCRRDDSREGKESSAGGELHCDFLVLLGFDLEDRDEEDEGEVGLGLSVGC